MPTIVKVFDSYLGGNILRKIINIIFLSKNFFSELCYVYIGCLQEWQKKMRNTKMKKKKWKEQRAGRASISRTKFHQFFRLWYTNRTNLKLNYKKSILQYNCGFTKFTWKWIVILIWLSHQTLSFGWHLSKKDDSHLENIPSGTIRYMVYGLWGMQLNGWNLGTLQLCTRMSPTDCKCIIQMGDYVYRPTLIPKAMAMAST